LFFSHSCCNHFLFGKRVEPLNLLLNPTTKPILLSLSLQPFLNQCSGRGSLSSSPPSPSVEPRFSFVELS
ncbi:hypothetical protein VIGAN_02188300, partial [Vigna angularis var. angularis]